MPTDPSANLIACGGLLVVANGSAVDTETFSRINATATWSARASPGSGSHRKYDDGCADELESVRAPGGRRIADHRASAALLRFQAATVPSSSQPEAIAVIIAGVFQVVARIDALDWFDPFGWGRDEADAQTGRDALGQPGDVDRRLRCQRRHWGRRLLDQERVGRVLDDEQSVPRAIATSRRRACASPSPAGCAASAWCRRADPPGPHRCASASRSGPSAARAAAPAPGRVLRRAP